jgi:hypothetical protein
VSNLARELRAVAADLWNIGDALGASAAHSRALMLEASENPSRREAVLVDLDDCFVVYGEDLVDEVIFADLDEHNDCTDPGSHVWLADRGEVRCVHCKVLAMPVKASREEAER